MRILSIETSCDETGVSIIEGSGTKEGHIMLLGNALASQVDLHAQYGGVFPAMAKRAHAEKFVPLLVEALGQAGMLIKKHREVLLPEEKEVIVALCVREPELGAHFMEFFAAYEKPALDTIAVTTGPGLEPALWVGVNAAKVLSALWNVPLMPINHMEGHVLVTLLEKVLANPQKEFALGRIQFPALALLVSGGHTELVHVHDYSTYEKIGSTRDDAVGEAFDKVARMLGLPYPGGPTVSKLAAAFRATGTPNPFTLPRPMLHSGDYDFSYSGIKTAVLYTIRDLTNNFERIPTDEEKMAIACAFEDAAIEVLVTKTMRAVKEFTMHTLIVGGGVAGNTYLRAQLTEAVQTQAPHTTLLFPETWLATDNSVMIAIAAYVRSVYGNGETTTIDTITANGNLSITHGGFRKEV